MGFWDSAAGRFWRRSGADSGSKEPRPNTKPTELAELIDSETGAWAESAEGPFWAAIGIARSVNLSGEGRTIAIVDGWIDDNNPLLTQVVRSRTLCDGASPAGTAHGATVTRLIAEVAPDVSVDFYGVCDPRGLPMKSAVQDAMRHIEASDAEIVNMSVGYGRSVESAARFHAEARPSFDPPDHIDSPDCGWCAPVEALASSRTVVAAVGNDRERTLCPARSPRALSVGYMTELRWQQEAIGGSYERAALLPPPYNQSFGYAYMVHHIEGALGSSFGAPLLSGALALARMGQSELSDWIQARQTGENLTLVLDEQNPERVVPEDKRVPPLVLSARLDDAIRAMPHSSHFGNDVALDELQPCFECSLFCESLISTYGLFALLTIDDPPVANRRFEVAKRLMPWSRHSFVNRAEMLVRLLPGAPAEQRRRYLAAAIGDLRHAAERCNPPSAAASIQLADDFGIVVDSGDANAGPADACTSGM